MYITYLSYSIYSFCETGVKKDYYGIQKFVLYGVLIFYIYVFPYVHNGR